MKHYIEVATSADVVITKNNGAISWPKFHAMPVDQRQSLWTDSEQEAMLYAREKALQSGGKVIKRYS